MVYHSAVTVDCMLLPQRDGMRSSKRGFLDIETTGLNPWYSQIVMVGLLYAVGMDIMIERWFSEVQGDESSVLAEAAKRVATFAEVVTYNGTRFDIPFLHVRAVRRAVRWPAVPHIDLLPVVRRWGTLYGAPADSRLHTVLQAIGVAREDASSGADVPHVYRRWLRDKDLKDRDQMLRHNADDLIGLPWVAARVDETSMPVPHR